MNENNDALKIAEIGRLTVPSICEVCGKCNPDDLESGEDCEGFDGVLLIGSRNAIREATSGLFKAVKIVPIEQTEETNLDGNFNACFDEMRRQVREEREAGK